MTENELFDQLRLPAIHDRTCRNCKNHVDEICQAMDKGKIRQLEKCQGYIRFTTKFYPGLKNVVVDDCGDHWEWNKKHELV